MNWSSKLTAISFLAVAALGAAPFMGGCTTDSKTSGDTTGGDDDDSDDDDINTPGDDDDTKDDAGTTPSTCEGNKQEADFDPPELQTCLESKCCTELKTCFDIADGDDGVGCEVYATCMATCSEDVDAGDETCFDACDSSTSQAVIDAYNAILSCGADSANKCIE